MVWKARRMDSWPQRVPEFASKNKQPAFLHMHASGNRVLDDD